MLSDGCWVTNFSQRIDPMLLQEIFQTPFSKKKKKKKKKKINIPAGKKRKKEKVRLYRKLMQISNDPTHPVRHYFATTGVEDFYFREQIQTVIKPRFYPRLCQFLMKIIPSLTECAHASRRLLR